MNLFFQKQNTYTYLLQELGDCNVHGGIGVQVYFHIHKIRIVNRSRFKFPSRQSFRVPSPRKRAVTSRLPLPFFPPFFFPGYWCGLTAGLLYFTATVTHFHIFTRLFSFLGWLFLKLQNFFLKYPRKLLTVRSTLFPYLLLFYTFFFFKSRFFFV